MTDLSPAVWKEIEEASFRIPIRDPERFISIGKLRTIIKKSRRSSSQNATLWMVYTQILERGGEELGGFTKDDLHEFFLIDYFGSEVHELFGLKRLKPHKRSSRLSKMEFSDFLDHIVRFVAEKGIVVEMPGEQAA